MAPLVSILVLNFNGLRQVRRCFPSLLKLHYPRYEIIVVDNGSTDGSLRWITDRLRGTPVPHRILALDHNLGYGRGKNRGAALARGKYIWLLDNDIDLDPECIPGLVEYMEGNEDVVLCGPVILDYDEPHRIVGGGFRLRPFYSRSTLLRTFPSGADGVLVSYVSGGAMFVRRSVWEQLDGFLESAQFYLDDCDFGLRCWIAGGRVAVVPGCSVRHWGISRESPLYWRWRFRQYIPGVTRLIVRNFPPGSLFLHLLTFELFLLLKTFWNAARRREPAIFLDYARAQWEGIRRLPESLAQRKGIRRAGGLGDRFLQLRDT